MCGWPQNLGRPHNIIIGWCHGENGRTQIWWIRSTRAFKGEYGFLPTDIRLLSGPTTIKDRLRIQPQLNRILASGKDIHIYSASVVTVGATRSEGLGKFLDMRGNRWEINHEGRKKEVGRRPRGRGGTKVRLVMIGPDLHHRLVGRVTQPLVDDPLPDGAKSQAKGLPPPSRVSLLISADDREKRGREEDWVGQRSPWFAATQRHPGIGGMQKGSCVPLGEWQAIGSGERSG